MGPAAFQLLVPFCIQNTNRIPQIFERQSHSRRTLMIQVIDNDDQADCFTQTVFVMLRMILSAIQAIRKPIQLHLVFSPGDCKSETAANQKQRRILVRFPSGDPCNSVNGDR